jgi:hypothetical protein
MPIGSTDRINIGVLAERAAGERRVALIPSDIGKLSRKQDSSSRAAPVAKPALMTMPTWQPVLGSEIRGKCSKTVMLSSR